MNKKVKRSYLQNGEAWTVTRHFYLSCCDCGLRHHILVEPNDKAVTLRFYEDYTGTQINRRGMNATKLPMVERRKGK